MRNQDMPLAPLELQRVSEVALGGHLHATCCQPAQHTRRQGCPAACITARPAPAAHHSSLPERLAADHQRQARVDHGLSLQAFLLSSALKVKVLYQRTVQHCTTRHQHLALGAWKGALLYKVLCKGACHSRTVGPAQEQGCSAEQLVSYSPSQCSAGIVQAWWLALI